MRVLQVLQFPCDLVSSNHYILPALTGNPSKLGKKQQLSILLSLIHDIRPSDPQQARGGEIPVQGGP